MSHLPVSATVNMPASCVSCSLAPGGSSLSLAITIPSPAHCRKSLFFSLNVQVNFYRLFIQPLYCLACYLLRKCSPQRERVGTQSNSLGQEGKTLHRVRGRGRNSEGPGTSGCGEGRKELGWGGLPGQSSGAAFWVSILIEFFTM